MWSINNTNIINFYTLQSELKTMDLCLRLSIMLNQLLKIIKLNFAKIISIRILFCCTHITSTFCSIALWKKPIKYNNMVIIWMLPAIMIIIKIIVNFKQNKVRSCRWLLCFQVTGLWVCPSLAKRGGSWYRASSPQNQWQIFVGPASPTIISYTEAPIFLKMKRVSDWRIKRW